MKTFRLFAALLVVALLTAPAFPQESSEITSLLAKARKGNGIAQYNLGLCYGKGTGVDEKAFVSKCNNPAYQLPAGKQVVGIHPRYFRPSEVDLLIGDATRANTKLGWKPKYDLPMLVEEMMREELKSQSNKRV